MSEPRSYKVKYEVGKFPAETLQKENKGGTDGFIFFSVVHTDGGGVDIQSFSVDGRTGKNMDDFEMFKVWLYFTKRLSQSTRLQAWAKSCCQMALDAFDQVMKKTVIDPLKAVKKMTK